LLCKDLYFFVILLTNNSNGIREIAIKILPIKSRRALPLTPQLADQILRLRHPTPAEAIADE
jgi:hypothetical protein